jgi:type IV pilus assembly protein PilP
MKLKATPVSLRWLAMTGLAVTLSACSPNHDDLHAYIERVKAEPGGPIDPLPQPKLAPSFVYEPGERRSPFTADRPTNVAIDDPNAVGAPDQNRAREFLEGMPLDSLTMVGTLSNASGDYGLVRDVEGRVHSVTVGNHMGFDYGRIVAINETAIELVEIIPDGLGGWRERPANLSTGNGE